MKMKDKILLIEDDATLLNKHIKNIVSLGYEIVVVSDFVQLDDVIKKDKDDFFIALHDHFLSKDFENRSLSLLMDNNIPAIVFAEEYNENIAEEAVSKGALDYVINNDDGIDYIYIKQMIERAYKNQVVKAIVADGNKRARSIQVNLLKKFNIQSYEANSHAQIETLLKEDSNIGLLVIDQSLDDEKGTNVISELRKTYSKDNLAIIGVSEHGHSSRLSIEFLKKGANDFITKPFTSEEFNLRVLQSLDTLEFIHVNKQSALTDHLTNMYNKRAFESLGIEILSKAKKESVSLACAVLDIDYFKKINDTYGHHIGDRVLVTVADLFREHFRKDDLVARVGGEEFVVLLSNISKEKLLNIFEGFREKIESTTISTDSGNINITISIGLYIAQEYILSKLFEHADELLYKAKNGGRNQVKVNTD
ncbi:GGDEF domain-containing response regulator [Candidatus Sulfurimonas baltica]|uniref:diguanylate cyclase n=1 Tax=Candidatus Sulfurimonas baltica TaxID=2740404 RepID=A0A7S7LXN0_9BACT|nr:diguanylate cyclase [Candidatus Sulfurimonas baltica]QOY53242.1 diguanylate cyclase [Candidatus Sulfurimonas baltica]